MSILDNYEYSYENKNGRPIFAPSKKGRANGRAIKKLVEQRYDPEPFMYHLGEDGGHVSALHAHRSNRYFAKVDLQRFFYSIHRNRVKTALKAIGVRSAEHFARWSCVKNPYGSPPYSLPYGFVQSPIIATLVLSQSAVGQFLRELATTMTVSVYVDDIALSSNNKRRIERAYKKLRKTIIKSNFAINEVKSLAPAQNIDVFNCHLTRHETVVTDERHEEFYSVDRSPLSEISFEKYCESVASGNA